MSKQKKKRLIQIRTRRLKKNNIWKMRKEKGEKLLIINLKLYFSRKEAKKYEKMWSTWKKINKKDQPRFQPKENEIWIKYVEENGK